MCPLRFLRALVALAALCLLSGCEEELDVFLFNDTDKLIMIGSDDGRSLGISPHSSARVNDFWSRRPTVLWQGKAYHYAYPLNPIPAEYTDAKRLTLIRRFEFTANGRIYILPNGTLPGHTRPAQPSSFPLIPK